MILKNNDSFVKETINTMHKSGRTAEEDGTGMVFVRINSIIKNNIK